VPYHVDVPDTLVDTVPTQIRTRIWLALAKIAQGSTPVRTGNQLLGDGYRLTYQVDAGARTVRLLGVESARPLEPLADAWAS